MALHESQLTAAARTSLQRAAQVAARSGARTLTADHLLYALLRDTSSDAVATLTLLGADVGALQNALQAVHPGLQPDVVFVTTPGQEPAAGNIRDALETARREAIAAATPQVTTRALLLGAMAYATPAMQTTLVEHGVTADGVRTAPEQVDETDTAAPPVSPKRKQARPGVARVVRVSPIFLGLLAVTIGCLVILWNGQLNPTFFLFAFIITGWVVSLALHEFGHALVAYIGGDTSVVGQGYLTLNPLKYTHPLLSIVLPLVILMIGGIGLPGGAVYINRGAIRSRGMHSLVSAAGPIANLICALLLALPFWILRPDFEFLAFRGHPYFWAALGTQIFLQITALGINLLPIPGLDGYGILEPVLPDNIVAAMWPLRQFGFMILIALFWYVDPFQEAFWRSMFQTMNNIGVDPGLALIGLQTLRFW